MKTVKALVVEHDDKATQAIDEVLLAIGHKYELATSLNQARELLAVNGYAYILLNCPVPARPGGTPRRQNAENFLDALKKLKGNDAPPVIIMYDPMPDVDEEAKVSWACDLALRGAKRFIRRPFRTEGRTLDRVIKKAIADRPDPVPWVAIPIVNAKGRTRSDTPVATALRRPPVGHAAPAMPVAPKTDFSTTVPASPPAGTSIPNEPIDLDDFMVSFCEHRGRENRTCRKRALLAAARHKTVKLPALAGKHKHGMPNKYLAHDLLAAWPGFIDEGVDLPPLRPEFAADADHASPGSESSRETEK